jgi:hypothetical protein
MAPPKRRRSPYGQIGGSRNRPSGQKVRTAASSWCLARVQHHWFRTFEPCRPPWAWATLGPMTLLIFRDLATMAVLVIAIVGVMLLLRATRTSRA